MLITYHGHSEFLLEAANGFTLLTDPYDAHVGYPMKTYHCNTVTVSHDHGDHSYTPKVEGFYVLVNRVGVWSVSPEVTVTAISAFHDDVEGEKRGRNLLMKIEMDGLVVAHMGDLGAMLNVQQRMFLGKVDILMLPVGGYFTINAETAQRVTEVLQPSIVIPMHYKTQANSDWPISDEKDFLRRMGAEGVEPVPLLRVTKEDLSEQPAVVLMQPRP